MTGMVAINWHPVTAFRCAGPPVLGGPIRSGAPGKRGDSRPQRRAVVSGLEPDDPVPMAERGGGRVVCVASVAGGIRGVDCGAQGRVSVFFFFLTLWAWTRYVEKSKIPKSQVQSLVRPGSGFFRAGFG